MSRGLGDVYKRQLKGLPVPHELYGEMTLESLIAVMAAIGLDLRTERLN